MEICRIKELENLGNLVAFAIPKDQARWRIFSYDKEANMEDIPNYEILGKEFGITPSDMVRVPQGHSVNIRFVDKNVAGEGVIREEISGNYDGAITNEKGILLLTIEADCTPVYIYDKKNVAIAMVHSGWRGTTNKITENAINLMIEKYGTKKENLFIYFGPSICGDCYEVGEDLIPEFRKILDELEIEKVFKKRKNDVNVENKFLLDVTESIRLSLLKIGIEDKQMIKSKYCTYHSGVFDSWRLNHDRTKQMLTGMMLR